MDHWKTTTRRFSPNWKTRPRQHREGVLGMTTIILCPECNHDTNLHFYEKDYPDFGFCQAPSCDCTCGWFDGNSQNN